MLVTGFNPWAGVTYNPSGVVARRLHGKTISGAEFGYPHKATVRGVVLDVAWADGTAKDGAAVRSAAAVLKREAEAYEPHLIVSFGVMARYKYRFDVEPYGKDESKQDPGYEDVRGELSPVATWDKGESIELSFAYKEITAILNRKLTPPFDAVSERGLGSFLCERIAYEGARLKRESASQPGVAGAKKKKLIWATGFIHVPDPMTAVTESSKPAVTDLDAAQLKQFREYEEVVVSASEIAVRAALGLLPPEVDSAP